VQFDYKTEADCDASRIAVKAQHADAASQSWCVPIPKPEKAANAKPKSGSRCAAPSGVDDRRLAELSCPW
jgi:hypothetical protein